MDFSYLLEKIRNSELSDYPFRHLQIENFFNENHFRKIVNSPEIKLQPVLDDTALFKLLFLSGFRIVEFPGCTINHERYIEWHKLKEVTHETDTSCEGIGVVLRLEEPESLPIQKLQEFLLSSAFINCIAEKFEVDPEECNYDAGIQKYLDGYEISPHPDVRSKALTYMVNINPNPNSPSERHHTSYLSLKREYAYVEHFWKGNQELDRCWIPWGWCKEDKQQVTNNSIVIFSPADDTLHAVKANYNHLNFQRTQLYGNFWYHTRGRHLTKPRWEDLAIAENMQARKQLEKHDSASGPNAIIRLINKILPEKVKGLVKGQEYSKTAATHSNRKY